jgi:hypothetical protein
MSQSLGILQQRVCLVKAAADKEPCARVEKLRGKHASGEDWFDDWCYKHHHWLRDSAPSGEGQHG